MNGSVLESKKILFFGPKTFNYEKEIIFGLEKLGAKVTYRSDKPSDSFWLKVVVRLWPKMLWFYSDWVFGSWLKHHGPKDCDIVFVIKGEGLSPRFLDQLRETYKEARFILYLWDSIENVREVEKKFSRFDQLFSFDSEDCRQNIFLRYRPLFFLENYRIQQTQNGKGCFFIGTLNGDRPSVILRVAQNITRKINFEFWLLVRNRLEFGIRWLFDPALRKIDSTRLLWEAMPSATIREHFARSAVILDIEHPNQVGLTMRTFEVLASSKKLITTNKNILGHDFYDSSRICLIDRESPDIPPNFLFIPLKPLPVCFFDKYSLRGWLVEILGGE